MTTSDAPGPITPPSRGRADWFTRVLPGEPGPAVCPQCRRAIPIDPLPDHHPRLCPGCQTRLVQLNSLSAVVTVALDAAPDPIRLTLEYWITALDEMEAAQAVEWLGRTLGSG